MTVAYELGKTVREIEALSPLELSDWIAFLRLREKAIVDKRRRNR